MSGQSEASVTGKKQKGEGGEDQASSGAGVRESEPELKVVSPNGHTKNSTGSSPVRDIREIMLEIRSKVKADVAEGNTDPRPEFSPHQTDTNQGVSRKAGELLHSEELRYINNHYSYSSVNPASITSHRGGPIGKLVVRLKRKFLSLLRDSILREYFEQEREFQARVVRYLNDIARYVDERDAGNFWELIRKVDVDVTRALERIERISDEQSASLHSSERRVFDTVDATLRQLQEQVTALQSEFEKSVHQVQALEGVARGLEGIVGRYGKSSPLPSLQAAGEKEAAAEKPSDAIDYSYLLLENRYRGSEEEIARRMAIYPEVFRGASSPVVEIGPGRGELLSLFKEQGIPAVGVDIDASMIEAATEAGHDVVLGDGMQYLREQQPDSLGGVIAVQVVEHLTQKQIEDLCRLCFDRVVPGGKIVFETINPRSMLALSSNYFRDPTHVFPLHPDTLSYTMTLCGLKVCEVKMLSPVPSEALLKTIPEESYMTPRWAYTVETLNHNINQLNDLLYGHQDFCVIAEVPTEEGAV